MSGRRAARCVRVLALAMALGSCRAAEVPPEAGGEAVHAAPSREDHGALIVLRLAGTYREMGRQAARLLGDAAATAQQAYGRDWRLLVRQRGARGAVEDLIWPTLWGWLGPYYERSGFFDELAGIADGLAIRRADAVRGFYGSLFGGGSTAFVATGSASRHGGAVLGRNVDWSDDGGVRRPVVALYRPSNGDRAFITAGWVLSPLPIVGLNDAGLAISLNFFDADEPVARGLPQVTYRRVVQRARTVEEAVALLLDAPNLAGAAFVMLADAEGGIAVCECLPSRCARLDVADDWAGLSNHARTGAMIDHDLGRTPDSFRRLAAVEAAVRSRRGEIDVPAAAAILRDRSNSAYANDSTVGNLRVLNSLVVDPRARTLWHSTSRQPEAPFGEMVPFSLGEPDRRREAVPADRRVATTAFLRERRLVRRMRWAAAAFAQGRIARASAAWDRVAAEGADILEPYRLGWVRARARWALGRLGEAESLLAELDHPAAPAEVRAYALGALGALRDRLGRRAAALAAYERAGSYLAGLRDHRRARLFEPLDRWIADGRRGPARGPMPATPDLLLVSP